MKTKISYKNTLNLVELAEIVGAFLGDGWIQSPGTTAYICGNPIEDREYYDEFLAPIFSKHIIEVETREFSYWGVCGITTSNKKAIQKMINLGCTIGKKVYTAKIPDWIMNSKNIEVKAAILRGIFDADGCYYGCKSHSKYNSKWMRTHGYQQRMFIGLASKILIEQISQLLEELNIEFKKDSIKAQRRSGRNHSNTYRIWINKQASIGKWFEIVGTSNSRIQTKFDLYNKLGHLPPRTNIYIRKRMLRETWLSPQTI